MHLRDMVIAPFVQLFVVAVTLPYACDSYNIKKIRVQTIAKLRTQTHNASKTVRKQVQVAYGV